MKGEAPDYVEVQDATTGETRRRCISCGKDRVVGDWPHCPHGTAAFFGEEPLEAYIDENLTTDVNGVEVTTRGQRRKLMSEHHLEYAKNRFSDRGKKRTYFFQGGR